MRLRSKFNESNSLEDELFYRNDSNFDVDFDHLDVRKLLLKKLL